MAIDELRELEVRIVWVKAGEAYLSRPILKHGAHEAASTVSDDVLRTSGIGGH